MCEECSVARSEKQRSFTFLVPETALVGLDEEASQAVTRNHMMAAARIQGVITDDDTDLPPGFEVDTAVDRKIGEYGRKYRVWLPEKRAAAGQPSGTASVMAHGLKNPPAWLDTKFVEMVREADDYDKREPAPEQKPAYKIVYALCSIVVGFVVMFVFILAAMCCVRLLQLVAQWFGWL